MLENALIMVDVQNDFCPGGSLAVRAGDEVVGPLNAMVAHARKNGWLIIASRDWHPHETTHFKSHGGLWPDHCVYDTKGAEFHPDLDTGAAIVVSKGTRVDENAYSAFQGSIANGQVLDNILLSHGVKNLFIGGLATDYCVKATVLDAIKAGYKTVLLYDCSRAVNIDSMDGEKAEAEMVAAGAFPMSWRTVINVA